MDWSFCPRAKAGRDRGAMASLRTIQEQTRNFPLAAKNQIGYAAPFWYITGVDRVTQSPAIATGAFRTRRDFSLLFPDPVHAGGSRNAGKARPRRSGRSRTAGGFFPVPVIFPDRRDLPRYDQKGPRYNVLPPCFRRNSGAACRPPDVSGTALGGADDAYLRVGRRGAGRGLG